MGKGKATSLLSDVLARVKPGRPGFLAWYQRLDATLLAELQQLRDQWHAGAISSQKRALAVAIADAVADRGNEKPSETAVIAWLNKKD